MYLWGNSNELSDLDNDDEIDFDSGGIKLNNSRTNQQEVCLDMTKSGQNVVIVKNGRRLCGTGACLSNYPIIQNKAYFECKLQANGNWGVGMANRKVNLNEIPLGNNIDSWVLREDAGIYHNGKKINQIECDFDEGNVIGVTYDHELLIFYLNGKRLDIEITGIRGTVFPVFYVDNGAILDVNFNSFFYQPPSGYDQIMVEKSII